MDAYGKAGGIALGIACIFLSLLGGLLPFMPGWIFFVIGLYFLARHSERARRIITASRRRWAFLNRWIEQARGHRWAPRQFRTFADLTDPSR